MDASLQTGSCPAGRCGGLLVRTIRKVNPNCNDLSLGGAKFFERLTPPATRCFEGGIPGAGCDVSPANFLPGCEDMISVCIDPLTFPHHTCTEVWRQVNYIDSCPVETHTVTFTITLVGNTCTGGVTYQ